MHSGDSLSGHRNKPFSTKDADHDTYSNSCSERYHGAWWYSRCHSSNLNGQYYQEGVNVPYAKGLVWSRWTGYYQSLKTVTMKTRSAAFTGQQYYVSITQVSEVSNCVLSFVGLIARLFFFLVFFF